MNNRRNRKQSERDVFDETISASKEIIEIEPDPVYAGKVHYPMDSTSPEALVIHCGDARFQTAFRRFITEELGLTHYTPLIIGGGVHALGMQVFLPKNFKILWEQIKFHLKGEKLKQVIIINHEDCRWYEKMKGYHIDLPVISKSKLDLINATRTIARDFGKIRVRTFWAGIDDGRIYFDEVNV